MKMLKKFKHALALHLTQSLRFLFFHKKQSINPLRPRMLIICPTGLGDNIWSAPALATIKQRYPNGHLAYLTSPIGKAIFQHDPHIDDLIVLSNSNLLACFKLWRELRKQRFEFVYVMHVSQRIMMPVACLLGAEKVVGLARGVKNLEPLLDVVIQSPPDQHNITSRLQGLIQLGITIKDRPLLKLYWTEADSKAAEKFLTTHLQPSRPFVILQVGAAKAVRQWQVSNFITLGRWLADHYAINIIIAGGPHEKQRVLAVQTAIPHSIALYGQLKLRSYAALIAQATLMVTADTGPMHIASATHTPLVILFGDANIHISGPFNPGVVENILLPPEKPFLIENPDRRVREISIEAVTAACEKILRV